MLQTARTRTIFFIHVEKTGGTSLRASAIEQFGPERVITFYGKDSHNTSPVVRSILAKRRTSRDERLAELSAYMSGNNIRFFSGHIPDYWKLHGFAPEFAVTLLRSPAERLVSNFFFNERKGTLTHRGFREYMEDPKHQNVQAKRFSDVPLSALRLVGITEDFGCFVEAMNRELGLSFAVRHEKKGSLLYRLRSSLTLRRYRHDIERLNRDDVACYEEAKQLWKAAKARLLG